MNGFFDGADDLLDSIQTKKITKTPTKRPLDLGEKSTKNDEFINTKASGPLEKKMRVSVPKDVILVQPISKVEKSNSMEVDTKHANENNLSHQFGDIADRKACQHEMCVPLEWTEPIKDINITEPVTKEPVKKYPFVLDPFQKVSIAILEQGHSVLVSAHTSAGKTVVAEYSIAMALRDKQRVIYTSPIKALSNQKYRELYEEFQDVGLMTGDITINPSASCIVMTTEILRSMLYRGSEILREIGWVIFDEIHYMRDKERGVVWEETIILLPDNVRFVFLSATIPNAREFANWIAHIHKQPCHVVYTDYRPTPLQHYIYPSGGSGLYLVVDEKGVFREENFQLALSSLNAPDATQAGKPKSDAKMGNDCYKIVKMIMERRYEPVIIFSFSKKQCEVLAIQTAKLDFNSEEEKQLVQTVFENAIDTLSDEDKKIPQISYLLPILKKGIAIHHSGLLPLLKEVIEILFQEGLIKCLFATETFSIGLNMPAKTVVFTSVKKFDGVDFRYITGGEYIQMSGRSGRRGIDERGIVIMMIDDKMEPAMAQGMVKGRSDHLTSSFHIGYNMLLNLIRVEGVDPVHMLRHSFRQFQNDKHLPETQRKLKEVEVKKSSIIIPSDKLPLIAEYHQIRIQLESLRQDVRKSINHPIHSLQFLQQGRLVRVAEEGLDWGWGIVVNFLKKSNDEISGQSSNETAANYIVDVLLRCKRQEKGDTSRPTPAIAGETPDLQVVSVLLELLDGISSVRIFLPKDLMTQDKRNALDVSLQLVEKRFPDGIPLLDPIEDMHIEDNTFSKILRNIESLEDKLLRNDKFKIKELPELFQLYQQRVGCDNEMKELKSILHKGKDVILQDELKGMKRVLRRLGFLTKDNVVDVKGRVSCEINTNYELVVTELLFSGFFNELDVDMIPAILSAFVYEEGKKTINVRADLAIPFRKLQEIARRVAEVTKESKLEINVDEYVQNFKPDIMELVHAWCQGASFAEVCKKNPGIFEGSLIRAMRRLDELIRQLILAAQSIGNKELEEKLTKAEGKLKRDIVFAASLYL
jgi:ATP-dependent RNA helicase DOB1